MTDAGSSRATLRSEPAPERRRLRTQLRLPRLNRQWARKLAVQAANTPVRPRRAILRRRVSPGQHPHGTRSAGRPPSASVLTRLVLDGRNPDRGCRSEQPPPPPCSRSVRYARDERSWAIGSQPRTRRSEVSYRCVRIGITRGLGTMTELAGLGQIEPVDLRQAWPHEATDFTRWLAEHLSKLEMP